MVETMTSELREISSAIDVLSSMLTPAILIMACAAILNTVSARLIRVVDRVRELAREIRELAESEESENELERRDLLFLLLRRATRRARMLQRAMSRLYLAIGAFVVTSIVIGVLSVTDYRIGWLALAVGFLGAVLLLSASVMLIIESRVAIGSTRAETKFIWKWSERHFSSMPDIEPPE